MENRHVHNLTVHLIDDDDDVRASVMLMLETSGYTCAEYSSGMQFLSSILKTLPGCAIIDMNMPVISGLQLQQLMHEQSLGLPVIFMTGYGEVKAAVQAMKFGALDFVEKPCAPDKLKKLVEEAFSKVRQKTNGTLEESEATRRLSRLTPREIDVLACLVAGDANKIIAHKLGISARTVEIHRAHIMEKTRVNSVAELVRLALLGKGP